MSNSISTIPVPKNEPIYDYAPNSSSRAGLQEEVKNLRSQVMDIPNIIGGKEVRTNELIDCTPPHEHSLVIGKFHKANSELVQQAI